MSHTKLALLIALIAVLGVAAFGQDAKLPVKVSPQQAYVFLDGNAIGSGNVTLKTTPGEHTIAVYNYGFTGQVRKVTVQAGKNEPQTFALEPAGGEVSSSYGFIQIEGPARAAVLLNGTTPDYFVGHVDEFNNHIGWSQQLIVPPGTHQLLVTYQGSTVWSGPLEVAAGQRVIVKVPSGDKRVQSVDSGSAPPRARWNIGTASAAVSIAPVSGSLAAKPANIDCNQTSQLVYQSVDTLHASMKDAAASKPLPAISGEDPVSPRKTTMYTFEASGPGGFVKQDATVNVNPVVQSSLETSPAEVHYLRIGNKVLTQEPSQLKWTTNNADSITVEPAGKVAATGEQQIIPEPKAATGPLSETQSYTLTATNVCGGSDTKTAQLQIKGMIEPYILSVFFPTGYPTRTHTETGLVASQQEQLMKMAKAFPLYAEHTPEAKMVIRGNADPRGGNKYNMKLSERRVEIVKAFLIKNGVPADKITLDALGESKQLDKVAVEQLESENPFKAEDGKKHSARTTRMAYNRRIDIEVQPADLETTRFFPHNATDADLLIQAAWPGLKRVINAEQTAPVVTEAGAQ